MNLREFVNAAVSVVEVESFGEGAAAFDVEFRRCSRRDLEEIAKQSIERVRSNGVLREEPSPKKFRQALLDKCIIGWRGLTKAKVLGCMNKRIDGLSVTELTEEITFENDAALVLLEMARANIDGVAVNFDDWVLGQATRIAESRAVAEADEKKT